MDVDSFVDLENAAQQLTAGMALSNELPRVERNLFQIKEAAERLASKSLQVEQESKVKASLLLGSKGFDLSNMTQKLSNISAAKTFEPLEPVHDTDIEGFLKNERENALLSAIENSRRRTTEEIDRNHWECMESEWEREKQKLLNTIISGQEAIELQQSDETCFNYSLSQPRSSMNQNELLYAAEIENYNSSIINGSIPNDLVDTLANAGNKMNDKIIEMIWKMVKIVSHLPKPKDERVLYFRNSVKFQSAFIKSCLEFLEKQYLIHMESVIASNVMSAEWGGVPGTYNTVRSFLKVRLRDVNSIGYLEHSNDGMAIWAAIYYCLRCGDTDAAVKIAESLPPGSNGMVNCLREYKNGLAQESLAKLQIEYARSIKDCADPFKRIVYCLIGQCDLHDDHNDICEKIEDYLWLKLSQSLQSSLDKQDISLNKLQSKLSVEYGESHFKASVNPILYFQVLFLTGQFESAIELLARHEKFRCHAIHIAIALNYMGILAIPKIMQGQLLSREASDEKPMYRINLVRLICMYTKSFEIAEPLYALQYFFLLRDYKNTNGENWFSSCICELVTETREFALLLGSYGPDGRRKMGAIEKFNIEPQEVVEIVAKRMEESGQIEDAVLLYDLAENYDMVVSLLNHLLVPIVRIHPPNNKHQVKSLALTIAQRMKINNIDAVNIETFYLLLDLLTFFDLYLNDDYTKCMQILNELQLIPVNADDVNSKLKLFTNYSDSIKKVVPDLLLACMQMLLAQYKVAKEQSNTSLLARSRRNLEDSGMEMHFKDLRNRAQALITFSGSLPYRLPGNTSLKLLQMQVLMN